MKVLQICSKPPIPSVDGGCKATNNISQGLLALGVELKILTLSTHKHPFVKEQLPKDYLESTHIEDVFVDTKVKPKDAFFNLFTSRSYNVERFYIKAFEKLIIQTLQQLEYDVILMESLFVMPYVDVIKQHSKAKVVYRAHNVENEIWHRNAKSEKGAKKRYLNLLAKRLRQYEKSTINKVDTIATITEKDKELLLELGANVPICVAPFGIDINHYKLSSQKQSNTLFYIGSMDWIPNVNGMKWLLNSVWGEVLAENNEAKLSIAGRNMPRWLKEYQSDNVSIEGEVNDAIEYINQHDIMVVPLFAGGGMRIKIIEAMALGKLVIATDIALEGINCKDKENVVIANTSEEFKQAILFYLSHPKEKQAIASSARELIQSNYDNQVIVNNLVQFLKQL